MTNNIETKDAALGSNDLQTTLHPPRRRQGDRRFRRTLTLVPNVGMGMDGDLALGPPPDVSNQAKPPAAISPKASTDVPKTRSSNSLIPSRQGRDCVGITTAATTSHPATISSTPKASVAAAPFLEGSRGPQGAARGGGKGAGSVLLRRQGEEDSDKMDSTTTSELGKRRMTTSSSPSVGGGGSRSFHGSERQYTKKRRTGGNNSSSSVDENSSSDDRENMTTASNAEDKEMLLAGDGVQLMDKGDEESESSEGEENEKEGVVIPPSDEGNEDDVPDSGGVEDDATKEDSDNDSNDEPSSPGDKGARAPISPSTHSSKDHTARKEAPKASKSRNLVGKTSRQAVRWTMRAESADTIPEPSSKNGILAWKYGDDWSPGDEIAMREAWDERDEAVLQEMSAGEAGLWLASTNLFGLLPPELAPDVSTAKNTRQGTRDGIENWSSRVCSSFVRLMSCPAFADRPDYLTFCINSARALRLGEAPPSRNILTSARNERLLEIAGLVDDFEDEQIDEFKMQYDQLLGVDLPLHFGFVKFIKLAQAKNLVGRTLADKTARGLVVADFDSVADAWDKYVREGSVRRFGLAGIDQAQEITKPLRSKGKGTGLTVVGMARAAKKEYIFCVRRIQARSSTTGGGGGQKSRSGSTEEGSDKVVGEVAGEADGSDADAEVMASGISVEIRGTSSEIYAFNPFENFCVEGIRNGTKKEMRGVTECDAIRAMAAKKIWGGEDLPAERKAVFHDYRREGYVPVDSMELNYDELDDIWDREMYGATQGHLLKPVM